MKPATGCVSKQRPNEASFHLGQREFLSVRLDGWVLGVVEFGLGEVCNFVIDIVRK
jgi:hypothetical protein